MRAYCVCGSPVIAEIAWEFDTETVRGKFCLMCGNDMETKEMSQCDNCCNDYWDDDEGATDTHCTVCHAQLRAEEDYDERIRNQWQG
jgi:hypothetical protein